MNIIENTLNDFQKKSEVFIGLINSIPDESIWGIQEVSDDLWIHFNKEWNAITPYLIKSSFTFEYIYPDIYIQLSKTSKKILTLLLIKYPLSLNYFWHNIFFIKDTILAKVVEGCEAMYISKNINIDIENKYWVEHF